MTSGKVDSANARVDTVGRFTELVSAFARLRDEKAVAAFLRDLCTTAELDAMGQRLQVARLVDEGLAYHEVSKRTGASTATVTRVAHWLHHGEGGYRRVLTRSRA